MKLSFDGKRLKEARVFNKLSITELADKLNVSKQMISKYENNKVEPSLEKSLQFFKILGFPREFFYSSENFVYKSHGTFFRSRLTATKKSKQPAEYLLKYALVIRNFLEEYIEFPQNVEIDELQDVNDIEILSKKLREIINVKDEPIEDMLELLELLGIIVVKFSYDESKVDAFSCTAKLNGENYFAVVTGNTRSFYRQQFSLAHELGHWLLHKDYVPSELEKDEYKLMEREANEFAAAFLLPKDSILKDFKNIEIDLNSLLQLKKKWKVSIAALIERAFQLNVIKAEERSNLYRKMNYHKWKVVEPLDRETPVTEPLALAQAIELLIDENIMNGYAIRREIQKKYNLFITKSMMAEVCNVDESIFESENKLDLNIKTNFISEKNNIDSD